MSLPTLDQMINSIRRDKKLLAWTIKHNLSVGKLEILDIPLDCQYCGRAKTHMVYFDFNTFMGKLSLHVCLECKDNFQKERTEELSKEL